MMGSVFSVLVGFAGERANGRIDEKEEDGGKFWREKKNPYQRIVHSSRDPTWRIHVNCTLARNPIFQNSGSKI
jgi:hypothetical protein